MSLSPQPLTPGSRATSCSVSSLMCLQTASKSVSVYPAIMSVSTVRPVHVEIVGVRPFQLKTHKDNLSFNHFTTIKVKECFLPISNGLNPAVE